MLEQFLKKNLNLSKAKDAEFSAGSPSYWRKFILNSSDTIFAGGAPTGITTTNISTGAGGTSFFNSHSSDNGWDQDAQGISFAGIGATTLTLGGGKNYDGGTDYDATGSKLQFHLVDWLVVMNYLKTQKNLILISYLWVQDQCLEKILRHFLLN